MQKNCEKFEFSNFDVEEICLIGLYKRIVGD